MKNNDIIIAAALRTPIGAFCGSLSTIPAHRLASKIIREVQKNTGLNPDQIDGVLLGNVLSAGQGQAPARQAAINGGLSYGSSAVTINKVCGSGMAAVAIGAAQLKLGEAGTLIAGGMENMSLAPYLLPAARQGYRIGSNKVVDSMVHDGLWDPYNNFHMGNAAEACAKKYAIGRQEADEYAIMSYRRARASIKSGCFNDEIVEIETTDRKGKSVKIAVDEEPDKDDLDLDKLPELRPAFDKSGIITAGNASSLSDGAAILLIATYQRAMELGLEPLARISGYATHGERPEWFTIAPAGAIKKLLADRGMEPKDVGSYEINEAFSIVPIVVAGILGLPYEKVNRRGGAVSLGHPLGASGARILVTLLHTMIQDNIETGVASLCIGGGEGIAMLLERL